MFSVADLSVGAFVAAYRDTNLALVEPQQVHGLCPCTSSEFFVGIVTSAMGMKN